VWAWGHPRRTHTPDDHVHRPCEHRLRGLDDEQRPDRLVRARSACESRLASCLVRWYPTFGSSGLRFCLAMPSSTGPLSLPSGQGVQHGRISGAPQWCARFARRGAILRFATAEAVGKSRFLLRGPVESRPRFYVSPDSTTECSGGDSKPQTSKPDAGQRARSRGYRR
jgi:hypothetical protein